jgi:ubiquinone/menaquinone biosynthesis C-methylase UbiE
MHQNPWLESERMIDDQLRLQVDISFERHHDFMLKFDLCDCRMVWDLGTGNGLFLSRLAANHPDIRFVGVDDKPHLIERAKSYPLQNIKWTTGNAANPKVLVDLGTADGIIMRYFILHLPNMKSVLSLLSETVQEGTILWIFDLDLASFRCDPPHPTFDRIRNLVEQFCERFSDDTQAASRLPEALEATGFRLTGREVEPFTNHDVDSERFQRFLSQEATLYHAFLGGKPGDENLTEMLRFIREDVPTKQHMVRYGMVMVAAKKAAASARTTI